MVIINVQSSVFNGRLGKIVGFRGDYRKGIPYMEVFIYDRLKNTGSVYPFAGSLLKKIG